MLTIGICLEDIKEASWLEEAILNLQRAKTEVYLSGQELLRELENGEQFDLLWLSVTLTDMSGVELGRVLREEREDERTFLVYSSNHLEDALQLFRVSLLILLWIYGRRNELIRF